MSADFVLSLPDIVCDILNFLPAADIYNMLALNKLWYYIITNNPKKYLRTSRMFLVIYDRHQSTINQQVLNIFRKLDIHADISKLIYAKDPIVVSRTLKLYLPNYKYNRCTIKREICNNLIYMLYEFLNRHIIIKSLKKSIDISYNYETIDALAITLDLLIHEAYMNKHYNYESNNRFINEYFPSANVLKDLNIYCGFLLNLLMHLYIVMNCNNLQITDILYS